MVKKAAISKEVRRTIRLRFLTSEGQIYTISLNCASAKLAGADGPGLVKRVMEGLLEINPFTVKLVKAVGAELVERRYLLAAEDFQDYEELDIEHVESVNALTESEEGEGGGAFLYGTPAAEIGRARGLALPAACGHNLSLCRVSLCLRLRTVANHQLTEANSVTATWPP